MPKHYPLLSAQQGIFRHWEAHPDSLRYNLPAMVWFKKADILPQKLQQALQRIIDNRQILHTRFFIDGQDQPRQYADMDMHIPIQQRYMSRQEAEVFFQEAFVSPFNLLRGEPLCRICIIETANEVALLIDMHHSICDGMTLARNLINRDVADAVADRSLADDNIELFLQAEREQASFASSQYRIDAEYHRHHFADTDFSTIDSHLLPSNGERQGTASVCFEHPPSRGLFLSAFALALSKYTHSQQVAFSTLIHGRTGRPLHEAYGMFVKTLPLSINIDNSLTVREFMQAVLRELTSAMRHSHYPITHFYRDQKKHPSLVFGFQGEQISEHIQLGTIHAQGRQWQNEAASTDSCLVYHHIVSGYEVRGIMAQAVAQCARNMLLHPDAPLTDIAMISEKEEQQMLRLSQGPRMDYDENETVVDMILRQAQLTPDKTAIVDSEGSITYGQLDRLSAKVAQAVDSPFVPVSTNRSRQFVVQALGIMRAGSAYVPFDDEWPEQRRSAILSSFNSLYPISPPAGKSQRGTTLHPTAYIIYTSGTTGEPKGVMIPHRALTNLVHFLVSQWGISSESRIACHSSFAFDASVEDIFPVLTVGGTLYIPNEEQRHDLRLMYEFLEHHRITGGCYTTRFGTLLASRYPLHVSYLCLGGEKLMPFTPLIHPTSGHASGSASGCNTAAPPPYRIYNTYGPTEFCVDATFHELSPDRTYRDIPIGRPLPNCAAFVVDPQGRLVPHGVTGELLLSGPQLALNVVTKLLPSSLTLHPTYPTGDLVRWNDEGELEFIGRKDNQIKFRGYRINPTEIELALTSIPDIEAAAVRLETTFLVAYYQALQPIEGPLLRKQLATLLPVYMLPSRFIRLAFIPINSNGKTDWARLPLLATPTSESSTGSSKPTPQKPSTGSSKSLHHSDPPTLSVIASLFGRILQLDEVQPDDDFFDLGGTSLDAMLLAEELRQHGYIISYADIFRFPTPRKLESRFSLLKGETLSSHQREATEWQANEGSAFASSPLWRDKRGVSSQWDGKGIILTGSTGYLGIHILHQLLTAHQEITTITCIVRGSSEQEARQRLQSAYEYYFTGSPFDSEKRVIVVNGDITQPSLFETTHLAPRSSHLDTAFIHCAADVRFFAPHQEIERTNVEGTRLVAGFCHRHDIRLAHISTLSVLHHPLSSHALSGGIRGELPYIASKARAEEVVRQYTHQGLEAQIIRLGFLAPRSTDGIFQRNADQSAFFSTLHLFEQMGVYPVSAEQFMPDVTPVDVAADTILRHALAPIKESTININHPTPLTSLLHHSQPIPDDVFLLRLRQQPNRPVAAMALISGFLSSNNR